MWRWKYSEGRGCGITAWADGRLAGHLGVVARDVVCRGQIIPSGQYCDAMVHADFRGTGVYRDIVATVNEQFMGYGNPYPLTIAFPFERQVRLLERGRLLVRVNQMQQIEWPAPAGGRNLLLATRRLALPGDIAVVERLWAQMKQDFAGEIVGVRDAGYLELPVPAASRDPLRSLPGGAAPTAAPGHHRPQARGPSASCWSTWWVRGGTCRRSSRKPAGWPNP